MAKDTSLTVSLFGRDVNLGKSLKGVGESAKTVEKRFNDLSKQATVVFTAVAGAAVLSAKAAMEDEKSQAQLANTLKNVVGANKDVQKSVEDFVNAQTLATGIADDQIRPAFDRLVRSTKNVKEAQNLTNLAMEIATAKGLPLEDVANALAKAHDGNVGALKRLGVSIDKNAEKSKNFTKITQDLGKQFKGALSTDAETSEGKMRRLSNAIGEAKESIGYALLPFVNKLTDALSGLAPFIERNKDNIVKFGAVIAGVAGSVMLINGAFKAYKAVVNAAKIAQAAFNFVLNLNPIGLVVLAVVALGAALVLAYKKSETFRKIVNGAFTAIKGAATGAISFIKSVFTTAFNFIKGYINVYISAINTAIRFLNKIHVKFPDWLKYVPGMGGLSGKDFGINLKEIPKLAEGGIVNSPTIAMIGEAGPEAVVPLNKSPMGMNVTINVSGSVVAERDLVKSVRDEIAQLMRRQGANVAVLGV